MRSRSLRWLFRIFIILSLLVLILVMALPGLLSTDPARRWVLGTIRARSGTAIDVRSWQLSWRRPLTVNGVAMAGGPLEPSVQVDSVTVQHGLWALWRAYPNIGQVDVTDVLVTLPAPPPPPAPTTPTEPTTEAGESEPVDPDAPAAEPPPPAAPPLPPSPPPPAPSPSPLTWPDLRMNLVLHNLTVLQEQEDGAPEPLVTLSESTLQLAGPGQATTLELEAIAADKVGRLQLDAEITPSADGLLVPDQLPVVAQGQADRIDLAMVSRLANGFGLDTRVHGELNGRFHLQGAWSTGLRTDQTWSITGLNLPQPGLDLGQVDASIQGQVSPASAEFTNAWVRASFLDARASGTYGMEGASDLSVALSADLERTALLLGALGVLPDDLELAGQADLQIRGAGDAQRLTLEEGRLRVSNLRLRSGEREESEEELTADFNAVIQPAVRAIQLTDTRLGGSFGELVIPQLIQGDWATAPSGLRVRLQPNLVLERLQPWIELAGGTSLPVQVSGRLAGSAEITCSSATRIQGVLNTTLASLRVVRDRETVLQEDQVRLQGTLLADLEGPSLEVADLQLRSSLADLDGSAAYRTHDDWTDLQLKGQAGLRLEPLGEALQAASGLAISMRGASTIPIELETRWQGAFWPNALRAGTGRAQLPIEHLEGWGLHIEQVEIPLQLENSLLTTRIRGMVNQGRIEIDPVVDFHDPIPVLKLGSVPATLAGVELNGEIADQLLGRIHPVFSEAALVGGRMDLSLRELWWPLAPDRRNQGKFGGRIAFADLQLRATGSWYEMMDTLKISERDMVIGSRHIDYQCRNGRIACSPTQIRIRDVEIVLSGYLGLDGSIDYIAEVPITRELVGGEIYDYLDGKTLKVPIRGNVEDPDFGLHVLVNAAADLAGEAAAKLIEEKAGDALRKLFD